MGQKLIPTLHNLDHSAAFRCLWALEELKEERGIKYHLRNYPRQTGRAPPELQELFPLGRSPILTLETTAEDEPPPTLQIKPGVLTEALLILRFLSDEYGAGLWNPDNEVDMKRNAYFESFAMMSLLPHLQVPIVIELVQLATPQEQQGGPFLPTLLSMWKQTFAPMFQLLEDALGEEKPWFAGGRFGTADFNVCWCVDLAAQREYIDADAYPKVVAWHERCKARNGYKRALEKGGGYDLKYFGAAS